MQIRLRFMAAALLACLGLIQTAAAHAAEVLPAWRETPVAGGWASVEGGTRGGSEAPEARIFRVRDITGLLRALADRSLAPRIVIVEGVIDASGGEAFTSHEDQSRRAQIRLPSNLSLIGADARAGFVNANLVIKGEQVIVRNLNIQTPWDMFPQWDPKDGPQGHWNSDYDGITIDGARHVWIDHVLITDAPRTDDQNEQANGQEVQHHDGALDIKNGADFITVSWSVFRLHDKNNLVGHSDSHTADAGHLRVTFHHNLFEDIVQRAPRVRYGQVHLYSNRHVGDRKRAVYPYQYSHGVGVGASLISEANLFDIAGARDACDVVKTYGGTQYEDHGSLLNARPLKLDCAKLAGLQAAGWTPPYDYTPTPVDKLAAELAAGAGPR